MILFQDMINGSGTMPPMEKLLLRFLIILYFIYPHQKLQLLLKNGQIPKIGFQNLNVERISSGIKTIIQYMLRIERER